TDQQTLLKQKAIDQGGYFPAGTCPTGAQMQIPVIWVENCNASYGSSDIANTFQGDYSIRGYTPVSNQRCIHGPGKTPFGGTIVYAPSIFNDQTGFGTTGLGQKTWRELDPGQ